MINDFEESVFNKYPLIKQIKEELYEAGAIYTSMSGSGSSVFGLFESSSDKVVMELKEKKGECLSLFLL
jgi:4-diphosphocytidyl-2-C-methyl-D-erythritol kinase